MTGASAGRLRALGWAIALETALLASLIAAEHSGSWLTLPLTLLQLPGWLDATLASSLTDAGNMAATSPFATIVWAINVPVVYVLILAANRGGIGRAAPLSRPYPNAIPVLVLATLVPMYMAIAGGRLAGRCSYRGSRSIGHCAAARMGSNLLVAVGLLIPAGVHRARRRAATAHRTRLRDHRDRGVCRLPSLSNACPAARACRR